MSSHKIATLADRGVVRVSGPDAEKLLQGIITNDMELLTSQPALHAALLSPQGKILFDFFIIRTADGYLLDTPRHKTKALTQRLSLYKLRADVGIEDVSNNYAVIAQWPHGPSGQRADSDPITAYPDPRRPEMGQRLLVVKQNSSTSDKSNDQAATHDDYDNHRITHGVPEGMKDFAYGDTFPHEALLDQLGGVSFTKGCYVGQEVVSRMHHRGTARKRIVPIEAKSALPKTSTDIKAGESLIGTLGTVVENRGLALLRLDRASEAEKKGNPLQVNGTEIKIALPEWATFNLTQIDNNTLT